MFFQHLASFLQASIYFYLCPKNKSLPFFLFLRLAFFVILSLEFVVAFALTISELLIPSILENTGYHKITGDFEISEDDREIIGNFFRSKVYGAILCEE